MNKKNIIAIRSLASSHHAKFLDPKIVSIVWNIGKRCNYDCSYCPPSDHDWISDHLELTSCKNLINNFNEQLKNQKKLFKFEITGGEPYVHPDILDILKTIKHSSQCSNQICVTTNGSLPTLLYEKSFEYITNLTISLHLERPEHEVIKILDKIVYLNTNYPNILINAQVMCLPGKFDFIQQSIIPILKNNNVKYTLRRIHPWSNDLVDDYTDLNNKDLLKTKFSLDKQSEHKKITKIKIHNFLEKMNQTDLYYSNDELTWFAEHSSNTTWQNIGVWDHELNYYETNSDLLRANESIRFTGWTCFVGIDLFMIDFDGKIYKGSCFNDPPIGHYSETFTLPDLPTTCKKTFCLCNTDITVRKSLDEHLNLITSTPDKFSNKK